MKKATKVCLGICLATVCVLLLIVVGPRFFRANEAGSSDSAPPDNSPSSSMLPGSMPSDSAASDNTPSDSVTPANSIFYSDYEELWSLIKNDYPFLKVAERVTGKDFLAVEEQYREKLSEIRTAEQFLNEIVAPCLNEFSYTGHMCAITHEMYDSQYAELQFILEKEGKLASTMTWEVFNLPEVRAFYGTSRDDGLRAVSKEKSFSSAHDMSDNLEFKTYPSYSAAYISIKKMASPVENNDSAVLKDFFQWIEENGYQHCIIDIRENGGGNDLYWRLNLVAPNLKEPLSYQYHALIKGEKSRQYLSRRNFPIYPISDFPKSEFPDLNAEDLQDADYYTVNTISSDNMGRNRDDPYEPLFSGDFWLLVGPRVYSASESFTCFCKETGFARLVGRSTGGDGMGTNPMVTSLPNTGICIQFCALACLNPDGSNNEEFGTVPDFIAPDIRSTLPHCLRLILEQQQ